MSDSQKPKQTCFCCHSPVGGLCCIGQPVTRLVWHYGVKMCLNCHEYWLQHVDEKEGLELAEPQP